MDFSPRLLMPLWLPFELLIHLETGATSFSAEETIRTTERQNYTCVGEGGVHEKHDLLGLLEGSIGLIVHGNPSLSPVSLVMIFNFSKFAGVVGTFELPLRPLRPVVLAAVFLEGCDGRGSRLRHPSLLPRYSAAVLQSCCDFSGAARS